MIDLDGSEICSLGKRYNVHVPGGYYDDGFRQWSYMVIRAIEDNSVRHGFLRMDVGYTFSVLYYESLVTSL